MVARDPPWRAPWTAPEAPASDYSYTEDSGNTEDYSNTGDAQSQADAAYQAYLEAQAAADAMPEGTFPNEETKQGYISQLSASYASILMEQFTNTMNNTADSVKQQVKGSIDAQLLPGSQKLAAGIQSLSDGTTNLQSGLNQLYAGSDALVQGTDHLFQVHWLCSRVQKNWIRTAAC